CRRRRVGFTSALSSMMYTCPFRSLVDTILADQRVSIQGAFAERLPMDGLFVDTGVNGRGALPCLEWL
ncbi:hypothetical protein, partial [Noviherbaspirillum malthae]|uniref:hypothetical protein n=1 Tax=Noviherbaspirillum malthae TaxID=1260987 RepID=UPI001E2C9C64